MNGEIRNHADIALEQPQVDPRGIVIENVSKLPTLDDLPDLADSARIDERVVDQQYQAALFRLGDELACLVGCFRHRLLEPKVLARLESSQTECEMCVNRGSNGDRVDAGILEEVLVPRGRPDSRIALVYNCKFLGIEVRYGNEIEARCLRKIAH